MTRSPARPARSLELRTRPVQPRGARTLGAILEAAQRILKVDGIEALTTQSVARQSGVAVGTVYRLFPNKEAIICRVYEDKIARVRAAGDEARRAVRPGDDWAATLRAYLELLKATERAVDFDQGLANAVFLIPEIRQLDVLHAVELAGGLVDLLRTLGSVWSEAALFDLAMTIYCLEAASWHYAHTCGEATDTLGERLLTSMLAIAEPAMRGDPEPANPGMVRERLLAQYTLPRAPVHKA